MSMVVLTYCFTGFFANLCLTDIAIQFSEYFVVAGKTRQEKD